MELSPCSKDGQGEGEAADIAHQPTPGGLPQCHITRVQDMVTCHRAVDCGGHCAGVVSDVPFISSEGVIWDSIAECWQIGRIDQ